MKKDVTVEFMMKSIFDRMTPVEIASKLHSSVSSVYYWRDGKRRPRYHVRRAIAELFQKVK